MRRNYSIGYKVLDELKMMSPKYNLQKEQLIKLINSGQEDAALTHLKAM